MTLRALVIIVVVFPILLTACRRSGDVHTTPEGRLVLGSEQASEIIDRSVSLVGRSLVIEGYSGSVTIAGTDADVAEIQFEKVVRERDERRALEALAQIEIQESGDADAYRFRMQARRPARSDVNVQARLPRDTPLRLQLENGEVEISGVHGPLEVQLTNGNVRVTGAASDVQVTSRNGNIEVSFAALDARARPTIRTTNGNVVVGLSPQLPVRVEAETGAGSIRVENLSFTGQRLRETVTGATFSGALEPGDARVSARTDNGDIIFRAVQPADTTPRTE